MQLDDDCEIVLTLDIPNQLLYDWHRSGIPPNTYSDHVNCRIRGRIVKLKSCLLYTSPSPRDATLSRMPSSA